MERHVRAERHVRRRRRQLGLRRAVVFRSLELHLQRRLSRRVGFRRDSLSQIVNLPGQALHIVLVERHLQRIALEQHVARELVADDIDVLAEDLVAMRVIEMEVGIDDGADGLVGDALDLVEQHPRRRGRHVVVHDDDVVVVDDDRGVADDRQRAGPDHVVDAVLDLVEPERLALMLGSGRPWTLCRALNRCSVEQHDHQQQERGAARERDSGHGHP